LYAGDEGYLQNQGFYVYRNKRLIMKATWFRLVKKEELNKLIRVRIDIPNSLDYLWNININKSQVDPPEVVRKQLKKIIAKISGRGKRVFKQRAARLASSRIIALWNREVQNGKVFYAINFDHPIVKDVIERIEESTRKKLISCLNMVVSSFPYDVYFSDAASDEILINREIDLTSVRDLCIGLITSLKQCGINEANVLDRLKEIEIPSYNSLQFEEIIKEVFHDHSN
jgi:hypothetical protein